MKNQLTDLSLEVYLTRMMMAYESGSFELAIKKYHEIVKENNLNTWEALALKEAFWMDAIDRERGT